MPCRNSFVSAIWCALGLIALAPLARADQLNMEDEALVKRVWARLVASAQKPAVPEILWPPTCTIENNPLVNAHATVAVELKPLPPDKKTKEKEFEVKLQPRVIIFRGMLEKVIHTPADKDMDAVADRLAYVLSHELCHITLRHCFDENKPGISTEPLQRKVFDREKEIAADRHGAELALKAGFSLRRGMESIRRMQRLGMDYSSFEGLLANHPSWNDRLVFLDREQAGLWRAMSAFENGSFFLMTEQFASAEVCFRQVTREFPKCYEAWSNLGHSLLMQYCDGLDAYDLRRFKIGQLYVGGFYRRPQSLEPVSRGIQTKIWWEAVACLEKSLALKKEQPLTSSNLGIAYLVHADGKPDLAKACKYLNEAAAMAKKDVTLDASTRAGILINAGVADLRADRVKEGLEKIRQGERYGSTFFAGIIKTGVNEDLQGALLYNRASVAAQAAEKPRQQEALDQYEQYLQSPGAAAAWWPLAYESYLGLAKKLGAEPKERNELAREEQRVHRMISSVKLPSGITLTLSEPVSEAAARLGEKAPVFSRSRLSRIRYASQGVEVLATDRILAIHMRGDRAPPIPLRSYGLGGETEILRLNMPVTEFSRVVGNEPFDMRALDDATNLYRFYPYLGLAVRLDKEKVTDLAIVQIPRARLLLEK
jgi:hypothetical protein